jgi:xanthine dehydrogenase/oxidase
VEDSVSLPPPPPGSKGTSEEKEGKSNGAESLIVGQPVMHKNAEAQVTGETLYTNDMPMTENTLHAVLVTSTRAHARLVSVNTSEAEKCPGYFAYLTAKDVTGSNVIGAVVKDEEVRVGLHLVDLRI